MKTWFRTVHVMLLAAFLLPALAGTLAPCGMLDCPMATTALRTVRPGHDCCPAGDPVVTTPCCDQHLTTQASPGRLAEKQAISTLMGTGATVLGGPLPAETSRPAPASPPRCLDCLSQSCVLRI